MADFSSFARSTLKQIKRQKVRVAGQKVVTDDIRKLKSLSPAPPVLDEDPANYYIEPVTIEYYIPKESRFAYEVKDLYIGLVDPEPKNETQQIVFEHFKKNDGPIDVMDVMNVFPQYIAPILEYYTPVLHLHEQTSMLYHNGLKDDPTSIRRAMYMNEVLRKYEPSIPALEILGDYTTYNINWCVRYLNRKQIPHSLEDKTVAYLIKLYTMQAEDLKKELDERFFILAEIYLEQAFPLSEDEYFELEDEDFD